VPPTSFARKVFYTLLQRIAENDFNDPLITFKSRREILQAIHPDRNPGAKDLKRLDDALFCLQNIHIKAVGSFWDAEIKRLKQRTVDFDLFSVKIVEEEFKKNKDGVVVAKEEHSIKFALNPILFNQLKNDGYFWLKGGIADLVNLGDLEFRYLMLITKKASFDRFEYFKKDLREFTKLLPLYQAKDKKELTNDDLRQVRDKIKKAHNKLVQKKVIPAELKLDFYTSEKNNIPIIYVQQLKAIQTSFLGLIEDKCGDSDGNRSGLSYDEVQELASEIANVTGDKKSLGSWILIARNMPYEEVNTCIKDVKEAQRIGYKGNYGAIFTQYIRQEATKLGIDPWGKQMDEIESQNNVEAKDKIINEHIEKLYKEFNGYKTEREIGEILSKYSDEVIKNAYDAYIAHIADVLKVTPEQHHNKITMPVRLYEIFLYELKEVERKDAQKPRQESLFGNPNDPRDYKEISLLPK
jgi:hypothetical protein